MFMREAIVEHCERCLEENARVDSPPEEDREPFREDSEPETSGDSF